MPRQYCLEFFRHISWGIPMAHQRMTLPFFQFKFKKRLNIFFIFIATKFAYIDIMGTQNGLFQQILFSPRIFPFSHGHSNLHFHHKTLQWIYEMGARTALFAIEILPRNCSAIEMLSKNDNFSQAIDFWNRNFATKMFDNRNVIQKAFFVKQ